MSFKKKLIEVALPLNAINKASAAEKSVRHGLPSNLHRWWARRPLSAARAVIFAQMVDDPSSHPAIFKTEQAQDVERQRLFGLIEDLLRLEGATGDAALAAARDEIWKSWRITCAENAAHPRAGELFNSNRLPAFRDPFAGGGALPLEAQRLGLESFASDLNPVAVLINKAMIEIPPKFAGKPPVNPQARTEKVLVVKSWRGAQGLAEDVRHYGQWMRDEAQKRIGDLYPPVSITAETARLRPDLKPLVGNELPVIAWIWARTVKSPNPAFANVDVPLVSNFLLSTKAGKEACVEVVIDRGDYSFKVRAGKPMDMRIVKTGTKLARGANFRCVMSGSPITPDYIRGEAREGRMGARLMAVVAEGERGRVYMSPSAEMEASARIAKAEWKPDLPISGSSQYLGARGYGMQEFGDLFTSRQLVALTTLADLVRNARDLVRRDAIAAGLVEDDLPLEEGGVGATGYADAVAVYLAMAVSKTADSNNSLCPWEPVAQCSRQLFGRQAIPMLWDFAEANPLYDSSGGFVTNVAVSLRSFQSFPTEGPPGSAFQEDACRQTGASPSIFSTDPPYYDNVPYADLSDFFYIWLRRALKPVLSRLFETVATPKTEELVAFAYRQGGKPQAEAFFMEGMTKAMHRLAERSHPAFPVTIYYAFRQAEGESEGDVVSTGWETFLEAVIRTGFAIGGTWPMRTEMTAALKDTRNALASSIVLVCRPRATDIGVATRREFISALKRELPLELLHLQQGNIAPVDLAQAAIGPGMAVYTRYAKVLDAEGTPLSVREALALINQSLDEILAEREGDFDADSRWAIAWFEQYGFAEGEYGVAETLSKAKNTSVSGLAEAGILISKAAKVRLLRPAELPADWDPATSPRLTAWELLHYLIRVLEAQGEDAAAEIVAKVGTKAEMTRELAYRLYAICERKKSAREALSYNGLVQSWPEITRLARAPRAAPAMQTQIFEQV